MVEGREAIATVRTTSELLRREAEKEEQRCLYQCLIPECLFQGFSGGLLYRVQMTLPQ